MKITSRLGIKFLVAVLLSLGNEEVSRATDYYVSPSGNDANTGLTTGSPWTFLKGLNYLTNGNTVWMLDGTYSPQALLVSNYTATATLKSYTYRGANINGGGGSVGLQFNTWSRGIIIDGLTITNCATYGIYFPLAQHMTIRNCFIRDCGQAGIYASGSGSTSIGNSCVIENNYVVGCGFLTGSTYAGIMGVHVQSNIYRNNIIISNNGAGIKLSAPTYSSAQNKLYNNITAGHVNLKGLDIQDSVDNASVTWTTDIYNNTITDGIHLRGGSPNIYNNVIYPSTDNILIATNINVAPSNTIVTAIDYNFATNTLPGGGANNLIINNYSKSTLFPGYANNRWWLSYTNPLRLAALQTTASGDRDFFNRPRLNCYDIGAIQYEEDFTSDTRDLNNYLLDSYLCPVPAFRVVGHKAYHNVRWNNTAMNVAGHALYRKENAGAYSKVSDIVATDINYVDLTGSLNDGSTYTYKLVSTNLYGNTIDSQTYSLICDKLSTVHPDRRISWGTNITGLPNGTYPTYTVWSDITTNIPGTNIVVTGDGSTDNRGAFAAALRLAPSNSIILIGSNGTYDISGQIGFNVQNLTSNNNKILRGVSSNVVIRAKTSFTGSSMFQLGVYNEQTTDRIISSRLPRGTTQMTWPGGYGVIPIQVGSLILIWENNASGRWGAKNSTGGDADPVYNSNDGSSLITASAPLVRQLVRVTSLPGSGVINFEPPTMFDFSSEALCRYQYLYMCNNSGVENITFNNTNNAAATNNVSRIIDVEGAYGCWLRNVRTIKANASHVRMQYALRCQIDGDWHDDAVQFTANAGIGIQMLRDVDSCVIMNSIFKTLFPHIEKQKAINGNVFAYNFYWDPKSGLAPMDNHGGHNVYNLYEGENGYGVVKDGYFNSEQNVLFHRCYYTGYATNFGAIKILNFDRFSRGIAIENTRLGLAYTNYVTEIYTNGWNNAWASIYRWGYPNMGNDTYTGSNSWYHYTNMNFLDTTGVKADAIIHGVYNTATSSVDYDPSNPLRTWRYSYFQEWNNVTAPNWYTNAVWPANGVDTGTYTTNFSTAGNYFWGTILTYIAPAVPGFPNFPSLGNIPDDYYNKCYFPQ